MRKMRKVMNIFVTTMLLVFSQQLPVFALENDTNVVMQFGEDEVSSTRILKEDEPTNLLVDESDVDLSTQTHNGALYNLKDITVTRHRRKVRIEYYVGNYINSEFIGSDEGYADADTSVRGYLFDIAGVNEAFGTTVPTTYKYVKYSETDRTVSMYIPAYDGTDEPFVVKALLAEVKKYPVSVNKYQNKQDVEDGNPIGQTKTAIETKATSEFWRVNSLSTSFSAVVGQEINLKTVGQITDTLTQRGREGVLRTYGLFDENNLFYSSASTYVATDNNASMTLSVFYDVDDFGAAVVDPGSSSSMTSGAGVGFTGAKPVWLDESVSETLSIENETSLAKLQAYPFHLDADAFDEPEVELYWLEDNWMLMHKLDIMYNYEKAPTYTVTFETGPTGTNIDPLTELQVGSLITKPANPNSAESTFGGWYKEASLENEWNFASDTVTSDVTLYAKWNIVEKYTVTFDVDGGSEIDPILGVYDGQLITEPSEPTKADYTFAGWYKEATHETAWNFDTDMITSDVTLYAKWEIVPVATYTVSFDVAGGSTVAEITDVISGETITEPSEPTKAGYTFAGWYKEATHETTWNFDTDVITSDVTLYAKWDIVEVPVATYTVSFDVAGGSTVAEIIDVISGETITEPSEPTKVGYTFAGWYKEATHEIMWNFDTDVITSDVTLYAKWNIVEVPVETYTVSFDVAGGSVVAAIPDVTNGATISEPTEPTKAGHTFAGWYKEATHETTWNFDTDMITSDVTLYAKWDIIEVPVETYTVSFDVAGGSVIADITNITSGETITEPSEPTKAGHTFAGWYKETTYETVWNYAEDVVTSNVTLYAKWDIIEVPVETYTVSFDVDGGSAVASITDITNGATISEPTEPTKSGYLFAGWYKDVSLETPWDYAVDVVTSNMTLYAAWNAMDVPAETYTVSFQTNGGTKVEATTDVISGAVISKPTDPTKAGYTFAGWYKDEAFTTTWNFTTDVVVSDLTLYAKWNVNEETTKPNEKENNKTENNNTENKTLAQTGESNVAEMVALGLLSSSSILLYLRRKLK